MTGRPPAIDEIAVEAPDLEPGDDDLLRASSAERARIEIDTKVANGLGFVWMALGVVVYFIYGRRHSILGKRMRESSAN